MIFILLSTSAYTKIQKVFIRGAFTLVLGVNDVWASCGHFFLNWALIFEW